MELSLPSRVKNPLFFTTTKVAVTSGLATMALLLAQLGGWEGLVGSLGTVAALIWYMWYTETKAKPDMRKEHKTQMEEQQKRWDMQMDKEREARRKEIQLLSTMLRGNGTGGGEINEDTPHRR